MAEEQLGCIMMAFSLPPDWQEEIRQALEQEDRRKAILTERKRLQEKLRRLGRLYADGAIDDLEYQTERDEIKRRLEELVVPEPSGTVEAGFQLETLGDVWPYATPWEKKEICRLMLKHVYIDVEEKRIVRVVPQDDFVLLFRYNPYLKDDGRGGYEVHLPEEEGNSEEKGEVA